MGKIIASNVHLKNQIMTRMSRLIPQNDRGEVFHMEIETVFQKEAAGKSEVGFMV